MDKNAVKEVEEIVSLNAKELDIVELEKRLELSTVTPDGGCLVYWPDAF
jgi:hypothetical protein